MGKKLYVGNLSDDTTEVELGEFFGAYGTVIGVTIKRDNVTHEPWGYGFVEMGTEESAEVAYQGANGLTLRERKLKVDHTRL